MYIEYNNAFKYYTYIKYKSQINGLYTWVYLPANQLPTKWKRLQTYIYILKNN